MADGTLDTTLHALVHRGPVGGPLVVLLHGRGSHEGDLFPLGRMLHPDATVVAPRAPFAGAPWGYGPGWAWYRFIGGTTPEPESFAAGQAKLDAFLDGVHAALGLDPATPLVLGGFSQGGTSSLAWALRHPGRAAKVVVFSGFLADHPSVAATADTVRGTRIWWGHGTHDPAIPHAHAVTGRAALVAAGADLTTVDYPGMGHTIAQRTLEDAAAFVREARGVSR